MEVFLQSLATILTPVTVVIALVVPSLWIAAAVGVVMAMIGVIAFSTGKPESHLVAAWLIGQVSVAIIANFIRRKGT